MLAAGSGRARPLVAAHADIRGNDLRGRRRATRPWCARHLSTDPELQTNERQLGFRAGKRTSHGWTCSGRFPSNSIVAGKMPKLDAA